MFYFRGCIPKFISRMIYFHFLSPHLEVNPAKNDTLELKLANRHSEIQSTETGGLEGNFCKNAFLRLFFIEKMSLYYIMSLKKCFSITGGLARVKKKGGKRNQ